MSEAGASVELYKDGSDRSTKVNIVEENKVEGGAYPKNYVTATIGEGESEANREIYLVKKEVDIGTAKKYFETWKKLKDAGIPTVPTMRLLKGDEKLKFVYMTDLTRDGSDLFGKAKWADLMWRAEDSGSVDLSPLEEKFLQVDAAEVEMKINEIAVKMTALGLELPWDDPFDLLFKPDGTWEVMVLDLSFAEEKNGDDLEAENKDHVSEYLGYLRDIRGYIKDISEKKNITSGVKMFFPSVEYS